MREEGLVQFQQELRLARGELIMRKISGKGTTSLQSVKTEAAQPNAHKLYYFDLLSSAIRFASYAHQDEFRKGTTIPYIVHPLDVVSILMKNGASEDLVIAGVLHDVLEDTPHSRKEIRKSFGDSIGTLVEGASESEALTKGLSNDEKKKTWKLRKTERIEKSKLLAGAALLFALTNWRTSGILWQICICKEKVCGRNSILPKKSRHGPTGKCPAMASPKGADADISALPGGSGIWQDDSRSLWGFE